MGCKFCNRKVVLDRFGEFFQFENEEQLIRNGLPTYTTIYIGVDEKGRLIIRASGDDDTENYYPKYCPECGRKLKEDNT